MKQAESAVGALLQGARHLLLTAVIPGALLLAGLFATTTSCEGWAPSSGCQNPITRLSSLSTGSAIVLIMAGTLLGFVLRPLQFPWIQFLEGYWGSGRLQSRLSARLRQRNLMRLRILNQRLETPERRLGRRPRTPDEVVAELEDIGARVVAEEADRQSKQFPTFPDRVMPTRLGNALRRGEDRAGSIYGLEATLLVGHLDAVAPAETTASVDDSRTQLDVSATLCLVFLILSMTTFVVFIDDGLWLFASLAMFTLAWSSYCGALVAAVDYTGALAVLVDLHRFALYAGLSVSRPTSLGHEQAHTGPLVTRIFGERRGTDELEFVAESTQESRSLSVEGDEVH